MELTMRIVGEDLADIDFGEYSAAEGLSRFFVGIQRGKEVVDVVPVSAGVAVFTAHFSVSPLPDGRTNFLGPYAHGTREARFCYLSWIAEDEVGWKSTFGRVKLHLSPLKWAQVEEAARAGTPIVMRLSLRGKGGKPVFASVPNDAIRWEEEKSSRGR